MASIRKLDPNDPKSPWVVEYTDAAGKRRRKTPKSGLKKDADKIRQDIEREIGDGVHVARSQTVALGDMLQSYLDDCERRCKDGELTWGSLARIRVDAKRIPAWLARIPATDVDTFAVQKSVSELKGKYARSTMRGHVSLLNQLFIHGVKRRWLKINPLRHVPLEMPKLAQTRKRIPSKAEIESILRGMSERQHQYKREAYLMRVSIVTLALFGGLRRGEICGLKWEHVDFATNTIKVRHSFSDFDGLKGPKTDAGIRDIPMAPQVRSILEYVRDSLPNSGDYILKGPKGGPMPPKHITSHYWPAIMRSAGLLNPKGKPLFTFHALRHAAVSLLIEQGLLAIHIKGIVGHSRITTTLDTYGHLFPEDNRGREAVDKIAGAFGFAPAMAQSMTPRLPGATRSTS